MGTFIQIIEYQTSRFDEVLALGRESTPATPPATGRTPRTKRPARPRTPTPEVSDDAH